MKVITIVAGFGRCGSSLVMQMLAAGGMPTPYSSYPSFEVPKGTRMVTGNLYGGALKVLDPHIFRPPHGPAYKIIWIDRDPLEQAKSMVKFMEVIAGPIPGDRQEAIETLRKSFINDRPKTNGLLHSYTQWIMKLRFESILADPARAARQINEFCGKALDEKAMARAVLPRAPECLPYMLEIFQMEAAKEKTHDSGSGEEGERRDSVPGVPGQDQVGEHADREGDAG